MKDIAPEGPHGWIQWKGTRPCIDLLCKCGFHGHVDGDYFFYFYRCPKCNTHYEVGSHVKLYEVPLDEISNKACIQTDIDQENK